MKRQARRHNTTNKTTQIFLCLSFRILGCTNSDKETRETRQDEQRLCRAFPVLSRQDQDNQDQDKERSKTNQDQKQTKISI